MPFLTTIRGHFLGTCHICRVDLRPLNGRTCAGVNLIWISNNTRMTPPRNHFLGTEKKMCPDNEFKLCSPIGFHDLLFFSAIFFSCRTVTSDMVMKSKNCVFLYLLFEKNANSLERCGVSWQLCVKEVWLNFCKDSFFLSGTCSCHLGDYRTRITDATWSKGLAHLQPCMTP